MEESFVLIKQGAEAKIYRGHFQGKPCIVKERFAKAYRHPQLDREITKERLKSEVRSLVRSRFAGVHTPAVYYVDTVANRIFMQDIQDGMTVKEYIKNIGGNLEEMAAAIGNTIGLLHTHNIIHGDLTTSNLLLRGRDVSSITVIDFGLSFMDTSDEDKGVDLYVLERALLSTHPNTEYLFEIILKSYLNTNKKEAKEVLKKLEEVRLRGRKRLMIG